MSSADNPPSTADAAPSVPEATEVTFSYAGPSAVVTAESEARLALFGELHRSPVRLNATLKNPLRFREALSALYTVVASDYRYVPKDRTAYLAYRRMRAESAHMGLWQAQQAYFSWLARND